MTKTRFLSIVVLFAAWVVLALMCPRAAHAQYPNPPDKPPAPRAQPPITGIRPQALDTWRQINASGFGDPNISWVNALTVFNGDLYGGTSTTNSNGGQIWRYTGGLGWSVVMTGGFKSAGTTWGISNTWVSYLAPYHGYLYAGTQNLATGAEIWRSADALSWTPVMTGGFGMTSNQEIMHLTVYSDTLYAAAGDWGTAPFAQGAQIWRTTDGLSWTNVVTQGFGNANSAAIISLQALGGYLYAGTWSDVIAAQLWRSPSGDAGTWAAVSLNGLGNPSNGGIPCLAAYNGSYYAGTRNWTTGSEVYQSPDAVNWTRIISNGFGGGVDAGWVDSLTVYGGKLYAAVRNYNKGVQVYVTTDGVAWPRSNVDGWGNPANQHSSDGDNGVVVYNGALNIGTYNPVTGGQIWQVNPVALAGLSLTSDSPTVLEQPTTFTATLAAGQGQTYAWSFGNGASAVSGRNVVSYTYPVTGTYHAVVTATNVLGSLTAATTVLVSGTVTTTTTSLASAPNPSTYGQGVTFTATVTAGVGVPIGVVTFTVDSAVAPRPLVGGVATYVTSTLTGGAHAVTAAYGGDPDHLPSAAGPLTQTVTRVASVTTLAFGPNPSTYGQSVTLTATVTSGVGVPTGVVTFTLDSTTVTRTVNAGGVATYVTSTLAAGTHAVGATYGGAVNYVGSAAGGGTQTVNPAATATVLTAVPNPSTYGQSVTFTATVAAGVGVPTDVVTFTLDSTTVTRTLNAGGVATYVTSTLAVGSHPITATYGVGANYQGSSSAPLTQVVGAATSTTALAAAPNPSTYGQFVTFTATVTSGVGVPTGAVTFTVDSAVVTRTLAAGVATYVMTHTLTGGVHPVTATYSGDASYQGSSGSGAQTVLRASTGVMLLSAPNPSIFGQSVTLTATVTTTATGVAGPTGQVTFGLDAAAVPSPLGVNGVAMYVTSTLPAGVHSINAVYGGDGNYLGSTSATGSQSVDRLPTTTLLASAPNPSTYGQGVTLTATVTATSGIPQGSVIFTLDSAAVTRPLDPSGVTTYVTSTLAVGPHTLSATYGGDADHAGSSTAGSQLVKQAASATALTSAPNPSTLGQAVTFTASVSSGVGVPTGMVTFTVDSATVTRTLTAGVAAYVTSTLASGSHAVGAAYGGDGHYLSSSGVLPTQVVNPAASSTLLTSAPNPSLFGQSVTFTASVSSGVGVPTGVVTLTVDSATVTRTLIAGVATWATSALSVGSHPVSADYGGDGSYQGSSSAPLNQIVSAAASATALTAAPNPSAYGQSVTFTATVSSGVGVPTGVVTFTLDSTTVTATLNLNGAATYATHTLAVGAHPVTVTYGGDASYQGSSAAGSQSVQRAGTGTTLTSVPNPSTFGQTVTLTATVTSPASGVPGPTGLVTFGLDAATVTATLDANGVATYVTSTLLSGVHPINAVYGGDGNYLGSASSTGSQSVDRRATTTLLASGPNPSTYGQSVTVTATVTATSGIPQGSVIFTLDSALVTRPLDPSEVAVYVTSTLSAGLHGLSATYGGDPDHAGSSTSGSQVVNQAATTTALSSAPNPSTFGQAIAFTATVTSSAGGPAGPTGLVIFTVDSATVNRPLGAGGVATYVTTTLPVGPHSIGATYGGDANYAGSHSGVLAQSVLDAPILGLVASNSSPTTLGRTTFFTATVAGSNIFYFWDFGDGSPLSGGNPTASHVYPAAGLYTAWVTTTNGVSQVAASTPVTVTNLPPVADAGPDQTVSISRTASLDGSGSFDPDGHYPLSYGWTQLSGTPVVLSSVAISRPVFTSPLAPSVLQFSLVVTDSRGLRCISPSTTTMTVTHSILGFTVSNDSPKFVGRPVRFTAVGSSNTPIVYQWDFADGSLLATGGVVTHTYALPGFYTGVVTATNGDGSLTATTPVTITVVNQLHYLPLILKNYTYP